MSDAETTATRDKERTRRTLIEAAEKLLIERGNRVSIADIAAAAGVSKSGLLHHFPSKEALLLALAEDCIERFRAAIMAAVDIAENRPGKLLRAYVRVLCDTGSITDEIGRLFVSSLWPTLSSVEGVTELFDNDDTRWEAAFARDGIDMTRSRIVRYAAERAAETRFDSNGPTRDDHASLRAALLAMAEAER